VTRLKSFNATYTMQKEFWRLLKSIDRGDLVTWRIIILSYISLSIIWLELELINKIVYKVYKNFHNVIKIEVSQLFIVDVTHNIALIPPSPSDMHPVKCRSERKFAVEVETHRLTPRIFPQRRAVRDWCVRQTA